MTTATTTATLRPWFWRAGAAAGISAGMMAIYRLGAMFVHAHHGYRIAQASYGVNAGEKWPIIPAASIGTNS